MTRIIATSEYLNDAQWFMNSIEELCNQAATAAKVHDPERKLDSSEVNIELDPISDRRDLTAKERDGKMFLIEETLTDGSHVYNIEIFS